MNLVAHTYGRKGAADLYRSARQHLVPLSILLHSSLPLKHLSYVESSGQVRYSPPRAASKVREHAFDFLADWVQHIPRARQHQATYAGHFANALGNLKPRREKPTNSDEMGEPKKTTSKWVKWRTLILRCWAVDPELCPKCGKEMKRSKALSQQHELQRLLKNLGIGLYPTRPRSPPPPSSHLDLATDAFSDCDSQVPEGWDNWEAA
ncbi:MAG: hypothetical protein U0931_39360 [Vulcanimicrobiota bacterium]